MTDRRIVSSASATVVGNRGSSGTPELPFSWLTPPPNALGTQSDPWLTGSEVMSVVAMRTGDTGGNLNTYQDMEFTLEGSTDGVPFSFGMSVDFQLSNLYFTGVAQQQWYRTVLPVPYPIPPHSLIWLTVAYTGPVGLYGSGYFAFYGSLPQKESVIVEFE